MIKVYHRQLLLKRPLRYAKVRQKEVVMARGPLCDAWHELIFGKNRGQIYDRFNREREELIQHLQGCNICKNFIGKIEPMSKVVRYLDLLTPQDFATLIREAYASAQGMNFGDDEEDDFVSMDYD